jgi:hypothetical protein
MSSFAVVRDSKMKKNNKKSNFAGVINRLFIFPDSWSRKPSNRVSKRPMGQASILLMSPIHAFFFDQKIECHVLHLKTDRHRNPQRVFSSQYGIRCQ